MKVKMESGHFLNEKQKEIKGKIMDKLMDALPSTLMENNFFPEDGQILTDIVISCLIMFMRENLLTFFYNSNAMEERNQIMDSLFKTIKKQVNTIIQLNKKKSN
jgi:hypothetical protein